MELWELDNSLEKSLIFKPYKEAKEILEKNGFKVIKPFDVKKEFLEVIKDRDTAHDFNLFNPYSNPGKNKLKEIYDKFDKIVVKESRSNTTQWSTLNNYLNYRSGCIYKWYYPNGEPKI